MRGQPVTYRPHVTRLLPLCISLVMVAAACSGAAGEATTTSTTSSGAAPATASTPPATATTVTTTAGVDESQEPQVPEQLATWELTGVALNGEQLAVAVANTPELRRRGLMFVDDLLDLDGMLFIFDSDTSGGFWMKDTLLPLDIAFFDARGRFVDGFAMEPCQADPCPVYYPSGSYRYALEMEAGTMPDNPQELKVFVPLEED